MTTTTYNPTSAGNETGGIWVNPTNVYSSNNVYATAATTGGGTGWLRVGGFGIDLDGVLLGIAVKIEAKVQYGAPSPSTLRVLLGSTSGPGKLVYLGLESVQTLGGSSDDWGWTGGIAGLSGLNLYIESTLPGTQNWSIDHIQVEVTYRAAIPVAGAQPAGSGTVLGKYFAAIAGAQPAASGALVPAFINKKLMGVQSGPSGLLAALTVNRQLAGVQPAGSGTLFVGLTVLLDGLQAAPSGAVAEHFDAKNLSGNQSAAFGVLTAFQVAKLLAGVQAAASGYVEGAFIRNPVKLPGGRAVAGGPRLSVGRAKAVRPGR